MSRVALRKRSPNGRPRDSVNRHRAALPVVSRIVMRRRVLLNVGAAMQSAREEANIAAEEVAARMGVNWRTVASWESGVSARRCPRCVGSLWPSERSRACCWRTSDADPHHHHRNLAA